MKTIGLLFFFLLSSLQLLHPQLKINEIMSNNVSAVMDDSYNYSMWVEVYNAGADNENLNQYYFTDDLAQPAKWQPAHLVIRPASFGVLWFEREEIDGHAGFKLDPEGGVLYLMNSTGGIVDEIKYPKQYRNVSYGRLTDGGSDWVYFSEHSCRKTNNGKKWAANVCRTPAVDTPGGFYTGSIQIKFADPVEGETIYYTTDNKEPSTSSKKYTPGSTITLSSTTCVRAGTFADDKLPGAIITNTYFINERSFNLPVISIVTDGKNLTDDLTGIYVVGKNGITRTCPDQVAANYNQDWDRPVNFEFFDENGNRGISQEVDVKIAGGCSRGHAQKSLKITARKKFGNNQLNYNFFPTIKPHVKFDGLLYRNSGNDFVSTMLRDGFMQTLIQNRMDFDGQAYLPTICYINGEYYGIQNLRETSNHRNIYSNYGLDKEEIRIIDDTEISSDAEFQRMVEFAKYNNINNDAVYAEVSKMIDVDAYINYMIAEIYFNNGDWPHHNIKMWKKINGGKWRPILFDTDFGYGSFGLVTSRYHNKTGNAIRYALEENLVRQNGNENVYMLRRLMENPGFKKKFIDRFCIHLSSTFETNRANHILDSLANRIAGEMSYHKRRFGQSNNFTSNISTMKKFSTTRPEAMLGFIGDYFKLGTAVHQLNISANIPGAAYKFYTEDIIDSGIALKYFKGQPVEITADAVKGYEFKHWEIADAAGEETTAIAMGSEWKYWDKNGIPAEDWHSTAYNDASWSSGKAQLGWGNKGETTIISYGDDPNNKYPTAYFRKTVHIADAQKVQEAGITLFVDDGAVVYVNGTEIGRYNMPEGEVDFNTYALTFNNGITVNFIVPLHCLKSGANTIAVEVHQDKPTTSDCRFNLSFSYKASSEGGINMVENPVFTAVLDGDMSIKAVYQKSSGPVPPEEKFEIYINEIVSSNSIYRDEYNEKDDYIEIYNGGTEAVNIGGWYLTDTPVVPEMYKIPETDADKTTIEPHGRIIFWADSQPEQGVMHTNFSLSKSGEMLMLSKRSADGGLETIDMVRFPALETNTSYSRNPDGSSNWVIQPMTFNAPNDGYTGIETAEEVQAQIYPTYVDDHFVVADAAGTSLKVLDLTGKIMLQKTISSNRETIYMHSIRQGIYIVTAGSCSYKIIKK